MTTTTDTNCPNCEKFHHLCKATCCGVVPFGKEFIEKNKALITREVEETLDFYDGESVVLMTEGLVCAFLDDDYRCKIYDERPDVCKAFGDETDPLLTCPYQTKLGKGRHFKVRKKLLKQAEERVNARMDILKQEHEGDKI